MRGLKKGVEWRLRRSRTFEDRAGTASASSGLPRPSERWGAALLDAALARPRPPRLPSPHPRRDVLIDPRLFDAANAQDHGPDPLNHRLHLLTRMTQPEQDRAATTPSLDRPAFQTLPARRLRAAPPRSTPRYASGNTARPVSSFSGGFEPGSGAPRTGTTDSGPGRGTISKTPVSSGPRDAADHRPHRHFML